MLQDHEKVTRLLSLRKLKDFVWILHKKGGAGNISGLQPLSMYNWLMVTGVQMYLLGNGYSCYKSLVQLLKLVHV